MISIFNPMCIFKSAFKCTLTSFKFFCSLFKTHFINTIKLVLIKIRLKSFSCFLCST